MDQPPPIARPLFRKRLMFRTILGLLAMGVFWYVDLSQAMGQGNPVHVVSLDGTTSERVLISMEEDRLRFTDGEVPTGEVLRVDLAPVSGGLSSTQPFLVVSTGERIPFSLISFSGEKFQVQAAWGSAVLSTDSVAGIVLRPGADPGRFDRLLSERSAENDVVIAEGDEGQQAVAGLLESIDAERIRLVYQGESRGILRSRIVAIVTADLGTPLPSARRATVHLVEGGSVTGSLTGMRDSVFTLRLAGESEMRIAVSAIASIAMASDSFQWISDLQPQSTSFVPLAALPFEMKRDRNVNGNPLKLRWGSSGRELTSLKGIGTRPTSRIEYANDAGYRRLVAIVGIDPDAGDTGDCEVAVFGDGIKLWSAQITATGDPVEVSVPIENVARIELSVRPGKFLDLGDHVNWCEARLVK